MPSDANAVGASITLPGTAYGAGVTLPETTPISRLFADRTLDGKRVRVEGMITGVCEKRGCWITIASDREFQTLQFKVTDGVMVFPVSAKGKHAVAEGTAHRLALSLEETRSRLAHDAEEEGRPFDPSTVTEPMTLVRLDGLGAVIRDQR